MKTEVSVYARDSKVYAISRRYKNNNPTDSLTIYEAYVCSFCADYDNKTNKFNITYQLRTPKGDEWGDYVDEDEVDEDFYVLIEKVKKEWIEHSNFENL